MQQEHKIIYFITLDNPKHKKVGEDLMNGINVRDGEPFEKAIKRFSKTCERAGVLSDIKKYRHYEKPSEQRKRKLNAAKRKRLRDGGRMRRFFY